MDMNFDDYAISLLLMFSIVRQLRGRPLTWFGLTWPVVLVAYAGFEYLGTFPRQGHNLAFVLVLSAGGAALGLACGWLSRVYRAGEKAMVRSTGAAAVLWILGVGGRLAFGLYAEHGGAATIVRASSHLGVTGFAAWAAGLMLMSLLEVLGRTIVLAPRMLALRG